MGGRLLGVQVGGVQEHSVDGMLYVCACVGARERQFFSRPCAWQCQILCSCKQMSALVHRGQGSTYKYALQKWTQMVY